MATDPISPPDADSPAIGRRAASRARLRANATLQTTTEQHPVTIRNLSCTGAMIQGQKLPSEGRTAVLKRGGLEVMGLVVWQDADLCGFHFFDEIGQDYVVGEARKPADAPVQSDPYHWTMANNAVTAEDWRKARELSDRQRRALRSWS